MSVEILEDRLNRAIIRIEEHNSLLQEVIGDSESYREEREFLRELIEKERLRNRMKREVLTRLMTAGIIGIFGAMLSAIWFYLKEGLVN